MPSEFRYSLTRVCLKSGQLTLPKRMLELFPQEGPVHAVDTVSGSEFELHMVNPRTVAGLGEFFRQHGLEVNDEVTVRPLEDERFAFTPAARPKRPDYTKETTLRELADKIYELAPLSIAEIRAMFPDIPSDFDLTDLLGRDGRLVRREGRWARPAKEPVQEQAAKSPQETAPAASPTEAADDPGEGEETTAGSRRGRRRGRGERRPPTVVPVERVTLNEGGLPSEGPQADPSLQNRAREALQSFGYRTGGLPHGQLLAHADLGRRTHSVLVHIHAEDAKLEWRPLLARRRETRATYLAVFGAHRDLLRLNSPADMARATLWSWEGVARARELVQSVPTGPFDLEPYFQRDGLFEHGLERFERAINKRIEERGEFSAVLTRLATMRAPSIFMLEDVVAEVDMPRDQAVKVLELLSQAPFHMVARVDSGEFCLRYGVAQGLLHLSDYSLSLRQHLPSRTTERLRGSPDTKELEETETSPR